MRRASLLSVALVLAVSAEAAAPKITGTPVTSIVVGQTYNFRPTATDADGNTLTFSIANRPAWASFSATTGQLIGTPFAEHAQGVVRHRDLGERWHDYGVAAGVLAHCEAEREPVAHDHRHAGQRRRPSVSAYSFQPTAKDPEGKTLTFSIRNKPSWATFSTSTGRLVRHANGGWHDVFDHDHRHGRRDFSVSSADVRHHRCGSDRDELGADDFRHAGDDREGRNAILVHAGIQRRQS